jgi:dolichol-phosphate mannosyltransferase
MLMHPRPSPHTLLGADLELDVRSPHEVPQTTAEGTGGRDGRRFRFEGNVAVHSTSLVDLTVVVPTFNEVSNISALVQRLTDALVGRAAEIVFVDDSTDGTPLEIERVAAEARVPVRLVHRRGAERVGGLAGAVVAGIRASDSEFVAVMDGDLQHPPETVPVLRDLAEDVDLAVASRYAGEGDASGLASGYRRWVSNGSTVLAQACFPRRVGRVCTDPMTGFFCFRRSAVDLVRLRPRGFKILLEILARHDLRVRELPFVFADRLTGDSKASWRNGVHFAYQMASLRMGRMSRFAAVGAIGTLVNLAVMALLVHAHLVHYVAAALVAAEVSILGNFLLQERFVFRDLRDGSTRRRRLAQHLLFNNAEALVRLPVLVLLVQSLGLPSVPAQAVTLGVAFLARFLFMSRVVYGPSGGAVQERVRRAAVPRWVHVVGQVAVVAVAAALVARWDAGWALLYLVVTGLVLALFAVAASSTALRLYAMSTPEMLDEVRFSEPGDPEHSFSLIVPARDEATVLGRTVEALAAQDHPDVEILLVVSGDDDEPTRAVAHGAAARYPRTRVVEVTGPVKNKPLALNAALPLCRHDVVGVVDAESILAPDLLRHVDFRFGETGADTVIGPVQLMNFHTSWWSLQNVLEYFYWFRSRLHYQAKRGFIPYSGNTIFVRRNWLDELGGWDDACLAEDCELGVRMSVLGARTSVAYDARMATREETPPTMNALFNQRVRWMQGFLQTYRKGEWRALPTVRQRLLARYTLVMPLVQALTGVILPLAIVSAVLLSLPVGLALLTFLPLIPVVAGLGGDVVALREFTRLYGLKARPGDYVRLVLGLFPYQFILSAAALKAAVREARGVNTWYKTAHAGAHHVLTPAAAEAA